MGATSHHVAPCCSMLRHVAPCGAMWRHVARPRATSRHVAPHRATLRHVEPLRATSRHVAPYRAMSRHVALCHAISRHVAPHRATSRHDVPCRAMSPATCVVGIRHVAKCSFLVVATSLAMCFHVAGDVAAGELELRRCRGTCRWRHRATCKSGCAMSRHCAPHGGTTSPTPGFTSPTSPTRYHSHYFDPNRSLSQTGLALMGFSRYCPSSLDLTNFVVREPPRSHGGGVLEQVQVRPGPAQASIWEFGNLGTWTSRNLGSKNYKK